MLGWIIGAIAVAVSAIGTIASARMANLSFAESQAMNKAQLESQVTALTYNIGGAGRDIARLGEVGGEEMESLTRKGRRFISTQRTSAAASGVSLAGGSPLGIMAETASLIEADKLALEQHIDFMKTGFEQEKLHAEEELVRYEDLLEELYPEEPKEGTGPRDIFPRGRG